MKAIAEKWIREPAGEETGFLELTLTGGEVELPIPAETRNVAMEDVTLGQSQEFAVALEGIGVQIYENEAAYHADRTTSFAAESLIPCGLFPADEDDAKDFFPTTHVIVQARVTDVCEDPVSRGFDPGDAVATVTCLGYEFGMILPEDNVIEKKPLTVGSIVSGLFYVWAWPEETE